MCVFASASECILPGKIVMCVHPQLCEASGRYAAAAAAAISHTVLSVRIKHLRSFFS